MITYRSRGHATQIDHVLVRRKDCTTCDDCKVPPKVKLTCQETLKVKQLQYC